MIWLLELGLSSVMVGKATILKKYKFKEKSKLIMSFWELCLVCWGLLYSKMEDFLLLWLFLFQNGREERS